MDRQEVGSIWVPNDTVDSIRSTMISAMNILAYYPSMIVGLHERFKETICTLEIVYGHLRIFNWNKDLHAHYQNLTYKPLKQKSVADQYRNGTHGAVFENWRQRNAADMELYNFSKVLFEVQFAEALRLLKELNDSGKYVRAPHCQSFLS